MKIYTLGLCSTLLLGTLPLVDAAESDGLAELLKVLRDNGTLTAAQYDKLQQAVAQPVETPAQPVSQASTAKDDIFGDSGGDGGENQDLLISSEGGLEVASYDGEFSFELGGRLMVDSAFYQQDKADLGNGTELRRARIELEGTMFTDWAYELGVDFSDGNADVKDAYMAYNGFWPVQLKVGQFKEPFSLEELTSSRYSTFMERALPNEFVAGRHIGIGAKTLGKNWTLAGGIFGESFDDDADDEGDEGWGLSGRLTFAPYQADRKALHFGTALAYRVPDDEQKVKYNVRPESHITDVKFLDTGSIKQVDNTLLAGLEMAGIWGPFSLQSEYMQMRVKRLQDKQNYSFDGWYVYGSWFITGESRAYKFKKGVFARVKPRSRKGAWELALRYSELNLNDTDINGGLGKNWTLGLNWYINKRFRLMANYIRVDNDQYADADGDVTGNDDPSVMQMRMQVDF
ncbi:porin [Candidatus Venteria ishoeyi]|uniref:OprO/OprP family phosphate-selective porin n=1 Tax=Candidatus Venteria ishoeyi TaxID=1899563 RepID=UPI0025A59C4F|nr:porin [Candidatus Venteria ishoeyi]MDM8545572.1 porin [Candidatus Venteria ishoeyi]